MLCRALNPLAGSQECIRIAKEIGKLRIGLLSALLSRIDQCNAQRVLIKYGSKALTGRQSALPRLRQFDLAQFGTVPQFPVQAADPRLGLDAQMHRQTSQQRKDQAKPADDGPRRKLQTFIEPGLGEQFHLPGPAEHSESFGVNQPMGCTGFAGRKERDGFGWIGDIDKVDVDLVARPAEQGHSFAYDHRHQGGTANLLHPSGFAGRSGSVINGQQCQKADLDISGALDQFDRCGKLYPCPPHRTENRLGTVRLRS